MKSPYNDPSWKSIDPLSRAQLVLVFEGLKPATITSGDYFTLPRIAQAHGLTATLTSPPTARYPAWLVADPDAFNTNIREEIGTMPTGTRRDAELFWHQTGRLLGYPECCIDEYSRERHPDEQPPLHYQLARDLARYEREGLSVPEVLDYRPPAFTPCSIECPSALETLATWSDAMRTFDPEAAEALATFNKQGWYQDKRPLIIT